MSKLIAVMLWLVTIGTLLLFVGQKLVFGDTLWWFPTAISEHAAALDAQFNRTLWVVGLAFTLSQLALGYVVFRYASKGKQHAVYSHGSNNLEATWTIITAVVFIGLGILGQRVWWDLHINDAPADAVKINVVAQQFQFNFHYSGADQTFGRVDPTLINDSALNFVGLDTNDAAAKDDIQATVLVVPVNKSVELSLRSKDVIHNFFVPALRFKQDTVPGLTVRVHFKALKVGQYEVPCAELCGQLHYNMKTFMLVIPQDEYEPLAAMSEEAFKARLAELQQQYPVSK